MRRNDYSPGGAPAVSAAQRLRIAAHMDWEEDLKVLADRGCDLLLAGRTEEFSEAWEPLIEAHRMREPAW